MADALDDEALLTGTFDHQRDAWEAVLTPVIGALVARADVDAAASQELYDPSARRETHRPLDGGDGGDWHCQPLGRRATHFAMFDFLAGRLPG
nr:hypothetical protein [uncultured Actinoplanes sp.]